MLCDLFSYRKLPPNPIFLCLFVSKMPYIYLLHCRASVNIKEAVYKVGKTMQDTNKRFNAYTKGSIPLFTLHVTDEGKFERDVIAIFDLHFKRRKDYGDEYFEGSMVEMINLIVQHYTKSSEQHYECLPTASPRTDLVISQYTDNNRPAAASYLFQRFMMKARVDPIVHCMDRVCRGNSTQGQKRHVQSDHPCPNGRLAYCFYLSWELPTKIPREVLRADYEVWRSGEPRFTCDASWERQRTELLVRGLMRNKVQGGRSDLTTTVTGEMSQEPDYKKMRTSLVKTDIFIKVGTWKEATVTAYEFPPLKEMWTVMVKAGWIRADEIMPIKELNSYPESQGEGLKCKCKDKGSIGIDDTGVIVDVRS